MGNREMSKDRAENGGYESKKRKEFNIVALIVCLFVAFFIWCYAKGTAIKNGEIDIGNPPATENAVDANT